jgi:hypothetical protein
MEYEEEEEEEEEGGVENQEGGVWYGREGNADAMGNGGISGSPGRVLERELAVAEPENRGGKLEEEIGGTRGLEGAEMGGEVRAR